jgi:tetratricopeptide (TPR) repeat protein
MASTDRRREQEVLRLLDQAERELRAGQVAAALWSQGQAIEASRALAEQHPDDPRHRLSMASALYGLASMLTRAGRPGDAVQALDQSEWFYRSIAGAAGMPDTAPLIADVSARRALAFAADGRGASAVPEAEKAMAFYEEVAGDLPTARQRDLARVCAANAEVLARYGDPDVAVASADRALRIYLSASSRGKFAIDREEVGYLVTAASVAATIHAWYGRIEVSLQAADLALQFVGSPARFQKALRSVAARVDGMTPAGRAAFGHDVAAVLRGAGRSLPGAPPPESDAGDDAVTAARILAMLQAVAARGMPAPSAGGPELTTLADALEHVGHAEAGADLIRAALEVAIITPAGRCGPQIAPVYGQRLAELAVSVLPTAPADGIRIGLEAHYLYAVASNRRVPAMRHQLAEFGPAWARVLLACSVAFEQYGDLRMALDLASWAAGVARQLAPIALGELTPLVRQCIERHGRMLIATGDQQAGEAALATARTIGGSANPGPPSGPTPPDS